ncbi:MAG: D-alanyl-D-alanine carboxypeptidase/D-alanyl-D-alanine-endopeptidase [Nocardiaceae bacterium]|nr:D-alanyl-D-alanine carboxypeptidase/D-alanyl-D-alanine-endopeptidase [Nocardiaceae bacterium]
MTTGIELDRRTFLAAAGVSVVAVSCGQTSRPATEIPQRIRDIMAKPRYSAAQWSLVAKDIKSGEVLLELNPEAMAFTGSTRKLFSVGMALNTLGTDHRFTTRVHRTADVGPDGKLDGNLVLVAAGDLTFGGRRKDADTVEYTDFDHGDANNLGVAELTPQDPLFAINQLAEEVKKAGITSVSDVVVDDRLFVAYRVPNGNLLIPPILVNENMIDLSIVPTEVGKPATITYRPVTDAVKVTGSVTTGAEGTETTLNVSGDGHVECIGSPDCTGDVSGSIPKGYKSPFIGDTTAVRTLRIEDPATFARTAYIDALKRNGITVEAPAVAANPSGKLPDATQYNDGNTVATYVSAPYFQDARLILKVSMNLGANLSLSLFGLTKGARTIEDALMAERETLVNTFKIDGGQFNFPTNGSGSPDSQATASALVKLLTEMSKTKVAEDYKTCLPILGTDGSLAFTGKNLSGKGHVHAKPGTTVMPGADGETLELKAQNLAGYIDTKSGRTVAYAVMVNNAGKITDLSKDVGAVFEDEGEISSIIYEQF